MGNRLTEHHCGLCDKDREKRYFTASVVDGELFPYCDTCINTKYRQNVALSGKEDTGLWLTCAALDVPYINEIAQSVIKTLDDKQGAGRKPDLFKGYYSGLKNSGVNYRGFIDSNLMLDDLMPIVKDIEETTEEVEEMSPQERKQNELDWGKFEDEEYNRLNQMLADYTDGLVQIETGQMRRYRDLCKAELRKIKADESGNKAEIESAQKSIKELMSMLKIDKFEDNTKSDTDRFIDRLIWKIEETEPAEEEDREKYRDIAGYEKSFANIMRSLQNLLTGSRNYPKIPRAEE